MSLDRIKEGLAAFIESTIGRRVTFLGQYPATVTGSDAAGRLEVLADDPAVRGSGSSFVVIRHGQPGYQCAPAVGARCLLAFEAGDPSRPFVSSWLDATPVSSITFDSGTESIARTGDQTASGFLLQDPTGTLYYSPAVLGQPGAYVAIATNPNTPSPPLPGTAGTPVQGVITTGNDKLKA